MAFYDYIILDGYRYKTLAKQWRPVTARPATARLTLLGEMEGTFGVGTMMRWDGQISVRHGEEAPLPADGSEYGNIFTLRATMQKREALAFTDHNGAAFPETVMIGPFDETALVNVWNSNTNKYYVRVQLVAKG